MVRQARSEATRKKIVDAAVELFTEVGYQATGLGDIIERAEMTKGALYFYHFDSKEALATAIIEEGANTALTAFRHIGEPSAPALENMIHGVFVVADLIRTDKMVRTGAQLLRAFGKFNRATVLTYGHLLAKMVAQARQAIVEGDLRDDLDPEAVGEVVVGAMLGAELVSNVSTGGAVSSSASRERGRCCCPPLSPKVHSPTSANFWRASRCAARLPRVLPTTVVRSDPERPPAPPDRPRVPAPTCSSSLRLIEPSCATSSTMRSACWRTTFTADSSAGMA